MTVYALLPVFNRLALTRQALACLRGQRLDEALRIVVIDDGSTDGTAEFLNAEPGLVALSGDGSLWWAGAIERGLRHVLAEARDDDWVLFVNNDTQFAPGYLAALLRLARARAPAAIGSVVRHEDDGALLSIGTVLDTRRLRPIDLLQRPQGRSTEPCHDVDVLSGRGALYPVRAFRAAGTMMPRWLPHYLADFELSLRVRQAGFTLLVSEEAAVRSAREFGSERRPKRLRDRFFAVGSPSYLPALLIFWWRASAPGERLTLLPRLFYDRVLRPGLSSKSRAKYFK